MTLRKLWLFSVILVTMTTGVSNSSFSDDSDAYLKQRLKMVQEQIANPIDGREPVSNERVLKALAEVPRHLFVPQDVRDMAYADRPLPIGHGQTISQPYIVASMTELLDPKPEQLVLEVGTGSEIGRAHV